MSIVIGNRWFGLGDFLTLDLTFFSDSWEEIFFLVLVALGEEKGKQGRGEKKWREREKRKAAKKREEGSLVITCSYKLEETVGDTQTMQRVV